MKLKKKNNKRLRKTPINLNKGAKLYGPDHANMII